jgi:hypothetical protein
MVISGVNNRGILNVAIMTPVVKNKFLKKLKVESVKTNETTNINPMIVPRYSAYTHFSKNGLKYNRKE